MLFMMEVLIKHMTVWLLPSNPEGILEYNKHSSSQLEIYFYKDIYYSHNNATYLGLQRRLAHVHSQLVS